MEISGLVSCIVVNGDNWVRKLCAKDVFEACEILFSSKESKTWR